MVFAAFLVEAAAVVVETLVTELTHLGIQQEPAHRPLAQFASMSGEGISLAMDMTGSNNYRDSMDCQRDLHIHSQDSAVTLYLPHSPQYFPLKPLHAEMIEQKERVVKKINHKRRCQ